MIFTDELQVECGSQFSVALARSGSVYTWGKGDYHRLGHGTDDHVRRPRKVATLQGKKVISIATGTVSWWLFHICFMSFIICCYENKHIPQI